MSLMFQQWAWKKRIYAAMGMFVIVGFLLIMAGFSIGTIEYELLFGALVLKLRIGKHLIFSERILNIFNVYTYCLITTPFE